MTRHDDDLSVLIGFLVFIFVMAVVFGLAFRVFRSVAGLG
jgi:hypothetical protein